MTQYYRHPLYYEGDFTYVQVPRLIFNPPFEGLSDDARVLYGMLLDRMEQSYDDPERWSHNGRAYVYFQQDELTQTFHIAHGKAISLFQALEDADLIQRERQRAARKPTRIYINEYWEDPRPKGESPYEQFQRQSRNPFKGPKRRMFSYINIYWTLFNPPYEKLSNSARILYGLLIKRMNWARTNNKIQRDEEGAYIYYQVETIMQTLHVSDKKATKTIRELEAANLIRRDRQGFGKPSKIRILTPLPKEQAPAHTHSPKSDLYDSPKSDLYDSPKSDLYDSPKSDLYDSPKSDLYDSPKSDLYDSPKSDLYDSTYMNIYVPNNYSSNNYSINLSTGNEAASKAYTASEDEAEPTRMTKEEIAAQINKERLYEVCPAHKDYTDSIIELVYDEVTSVYPCARIGQATRSRAEVRARLTSLTSEAVEGVIDRMTRLPEWPRNPRAYLLTSLYNAATTPTAGGRQTAQEIHDAEVAKYVNRLREEMEAREAQEQEEQYGQ